MPVGSPKGECEASLPGFDLEALDISLETFCLLEARDSVVAAHDVIEAFGKAANITSDNRSIFFVRDVVKHVAVASLTVERTPPRPGVAVLERRA